MAKKTSQAQRIRNYMTQQPKLTVSQVAKDLGLKYQAVYMVKRAAEKKLEKIRAKAKVGNKAEAWANLVVTTSDTPLPVTMAEPKADPVNHPAHYKVGGIETIDFIEAKKLNYNLGNAVKYITRADHKGNRAQDLEKALWYIKRELGHTN